MMGDAHADEGSRDCAVLFVEDDPPFAESWMRLLRRDGFPVDWCESGEEALKLYDPERHGIVLLDLSLPGMTGAQWARQIRQRHPGLEIIAISAFAAFDEWRDRAREAGIAVLLDKGRARYSIDVLPRLLEAREHFKRNKACEENAP
jgi:CheY-like chemotaxis protein